MNITISTIDDLAEMPAPPSPPPRSCHARQRRFVSVYAPCVIGGALIIYGQVQGCNEITRQFVTGLALTVGALCGFVLPKLANRL